MRRPELILQFDPGAPHPIKEGATLIDFVKALPDRRWDPTRKVWVVTGTGPGPEGKFERAGFDIDTSDPEFDDILGIDDLVEPITHLATSRREVFVRPRFLGRDRTLARLGGTAAWDSTRERFALSVTGILSGGQPLPDLEFSDAAIDAAREALGRVTVDESVAENVSVLAQAKDAAEVAEHVQQLSESVGDIPAWFGLDLYPYQRLGALSAAAGQSFIADEPGLGKTRQALAATALLAPKRLLIVGPPVSLTNWERETTASGLAHVAAGMLDGTVDDGFGGQESLSVAAEGTVTDLGGFSGATFSGFITPPVNKITPSRKIRDFPDAGVVIVSDDTAKSRPQLLADLIEWGPEVTIVDEIHREGNWESKRGEVVRKLSYATTTLTIGLSGTPLDNSPAQLANPTEITGHLAPVFGGKEELLSTYCRRDRFDNWVPRKNTLRRLGRILDGKVWVRRTKADVLPFLPKKTRRLEWVDVPLSKYRQAHRETLMKLGERAQAFFDEKGEWPTAEKDLKLIIGDAFAMTSAMRTAAGLAKVDVVTERTLAHFDSIETDSQTCERPLIVWLHNKPVASGLLEALTAAGIDGVQIISGKTPSARRDEIVDSFQAGAVPVLLASITAANVAITLTRCCDMYFAERDWRPPQITQAEDRAVRIGQKRPVTVTTIGAVGTLDERIEATLASKGDILAQILHGADNRPSTAKTSDMSPLSDIVLPMAADAVKGEQSGKLAGWRAEAERAAEAA